MIREIKLKEEKFYIKVGKRKSGNLNYFQTNDQNRKKELSRYKVRKVNLNHMSFLKFKEKINLHTHKSS